MAAQALASAPSGRFIKVYLLVWALFAAAGLAYLALLAFRPDMLVVPAQRTQVAEPDPALHAATQALAEMGGMRRSVSDMQRDVVQLKETLEQHDQQEKGFEQRLTVLEERVASLPALQKPKTSDKTSDKASDKTSDKASDKTSDKASDRANDKAQPRPQQGQRTSQAHLITAPEPAAASEATPAQGPAQGEGAPAGIVTSSLAAMGSAPSSPTIHFGAPIVTQTGTAFFAVQLSAGPSINGLKTRWSQLSEKYGSALASLEPRYVKPKNEGGPYRLVAGPLPTKADAERVCAEMAASRRDCFPTAFIGEPL